jgi:hypothetical protein
MLALTPAMSHFLQTQKTSQYTTRLALSDIVKAVLLQRFQGLSVLFRQLCQLIGIKNGKILSF